MHRKGFALLEIVMVIGIMALLAGGGFYVSHLQNQKSAVEAGQNAIQQAQDAAKQATAASQAEQNAIDQIASSTAPQSAPAPEAATPTDPFAGLGGNKYADGILPLGDYKYVTSGPKKGYIYLCNANTGGGGAQTNGSWITGNTWNVNKKISVRGAVSWPGASITIAEYGSSRVITTNDLPKNHTMGIFPVQASDPAYQIDRNPNSIKLQSISLTLPLHPAASLTPNCIGGEVGVMTNGVMLFNGFDALFRDAAAHEVQDSCDAHPQESGEYHYHSLSACFKNPDVSSVIGFAFDGFPITGSAISPGRYLTTSDLDECHGMTSPLTLDGKTVTIYHYVMTKDFPYSVSCFHGTPAVHGPTAAPVSATGNSGSGAPQPPQIAIDACAKKFTGNPCSFASPQGNTISGTCNFPPGQTSLACIP